MPDEATDPAGQFDTHVLAINSNGTLHERH